MDAEPQNAPIFIGGVGRSGTTLMRVLLDAHPRICCGPELKALPQISELFQSFLGGERRMEAYGISPADLQGYFRQFVDSLTGNFRRSSGKPRWAEKTPNNVRHMATLGTIFPDARFIHMVRDGRDVACSLVTMNWRDIRTGEKLSYTQNIASAAGYWQNIVRHAWHQASLPILRNRVIQVPYEGMVRNVEGVMRPLLQFLGEQWDPAILEAHKKDRSHEPHESSSEQATRPVYDTAIGRWKRDMSPADKIAFKAEAQPLLEQMGYATDDKW
jgi:hypothetical protein